MPRYAITSGMTQIRIGRLIAPIEGVPEVVSVLPALIRKQEELVDNVRYPWCLKSLISRCIYAWTYACPDFRLPKVSVMRTNH
jgi:hypothetical protein